MLDRAHPPPDVSLHARLRVGGFVLDPRSRELRRDAALRGKRLSAKAQHVLLVLAARPGEVVTRDELMDAVWAHTFPTGDVLTQAVVQLRRAFGDEAEKPRVIETVAKSGYRLMVEATFERAGPPAAAANDASPLPAGSSDEPAAAVRTRAGAPRRWSRTGLIAGVLGAGVAMAIAVGSMSRGGSDAPRAAFVAEPVRLTTDTRNERAPALAPDGRRIAFMADWSADGSVAIRLQAIDGFASQPLSAPPAGARDAWPSWSPDGERVAFRRLYRDERCELYAVTVTGAVERKLGECDPRWRGLAWTASGDALLIGGQRDDAEIGALRRLDVARGEWQPLRYPGRVGDWETLPRPSPDGRRVAFLRGVAAVDVMLLDPRRGTVQRVTPSPGDVRGFDWLDDARLLLSWVDQQGDRLRILEVATRAWQDFPSRVPGQAPSVAGARVAWQVPNSRFRLLQAPLDTPDAAPQPALEASASDLLPSLGDDGTLAFYSDRSGVLALWFARIEADGRAPWPVAGLSPMPRFPPAWTADRRVLVVGASAAGDGLHEVDAQSGRVRRLPCSGLDVRYAFPLDAARLGVLFADGQGQSLALFDAQCRQRHGAAVVQDVGYARWDAPRSRILFARSGRPGVWSVEDLAHPPVRVLDYAGGPPFYRGFEPRGDALYFLARAPAPVGLVLLRAALDDPQRAPERLRERLPESMSPSFTLDASAQRLMFSEEVTPALDLWTAELSDARAPAR
jgi:DNA-binding winged helix-turn-helix (wHTH) protein/dipeptidyl aminopeptidase/acylaminoacyl peptidase